MCGDNRWAMSRPGQIGLAVMITIVFGLAQLPPIETMTDRGAGIVAFELARTTPRAQEILQDWSEEGRDAARTSLLLDYGFLLGYGALLALLGRAVRSRAAVIAAIAAAGLDAIENFALLRVAAGHPEQPWPAIAFASAVPKFVCVTGAIVTIAGRTVAARRRGRP
jgi:hypothetical protein